ncbi:MAG: hypothetical protein A2057_11725 [Ignavibacteria bacterium GWA2_35_9]|nr:MAG: hypothetical protein A2057_11725 [Ignavibacteria bacterium GWA2_35_9]OGU43695.1 MAG: hypothetical protein A2000_06305 [Ignavibacteria bacterium GWB2_36_8]OGU52918.1 MAG: hypothetical protein A2080_10405 [Ignavibacteria bacterium GWC2_36_12]
MIEVKEMTYYKKFIAVSNFIKLLDSFVLPLVKKHMDNERIDELNKIWQEKLKVIPRDISDQDKFEIAYSNWIWKWSIAFKFIKEHLGENGIEEFKRADIEALKQKDSRLKMLTLKGIRAISPSVAFSMIEKQMAYEMQVFTPAEVIELNKERLVFDIQHCKLLDFSECEDVCLIGCQEIFPKLFAEHLKVKMDTDRIDSSCTVTLTPLE